MSLNVRGPSLDLQHTNQYSKSELKVFEYFETFCTHVCTLNSHFLLLRIFIIEEICDSLICIMTAIFFPLSNDTSLIAYIRSIIHKLLSQNRILIQRYIHTSEKEIASSQSLSIFDSMQKSNKIIETFP